MQIFNNCAGLSEILDITDKEKLIFKFSSPYFPQKTFITTAYDEDCIEEEMIYFLEMKGIISEETAKEFFEKSSCDVIENVTECFEYPKELVLNKESFIEYLTYKYFVEEDEPISEKILITFVRDILNYVEQLDEEVETKIEVFKELTKSFFNLRDLELQSCSIFRK